MLRYDFPNTQDDFVVFVHPVDLGGQPNVIGAWVYGDGSAHYLNAWVQDSQDEVWSVHLGRVGATGWTQMSGVIDPARAWPSGHISGPDNGRVDYPVRFYALVLDRPGSGTQTGQIFIDDISAWTREVPPTATPYSGPTATPVPAQPTDTPTPEPAESEGPLDFPVPTYLDAWESAEGGYMCTIVVRIQGGAPPFTVYHDATAYGPTSDRNYPLRFHAGGGCTIVHTIKVVSEDGQEVAHSYYINSPWCN
jgi:hypothetical protein